MFRARVATNGILAPQQTVAHSKSGARSRANIASKHLVSQGQRSAIWLTVLWHVGSGLPWSWLAGRADGGERGHLQQMLGSLRESALITADAGFVGYDVWKTLLDPGHQLLIRVGSNVKLLKNLGYTREREGLVYLWPDQKAQAGGPPLVLRLLTIHNGKHPVYLVTSVLDGGQLSNAAAVNIYRCRWGIELFYRHCKQTFERADYAATTQTTR